MLWVHVVGNTYLCCGEYVHQCCPQHVTHNISLVLHIISSTTCCGFVVGDMLWTTSKLYVLGDMSHNISKLFLNVMNMSGSIEGNEFQNGPNAIECYPYFDMDFGVLIRSERI